MQQFETHLYQFQEEHKKPVQEGHLILMALIAFCFWNCIKKYRFDSF